MLRIKSLEKLVHELSRLPGIGPKTAQRLAYFIVKSKDQYGERLTEALRGVREEVRECPQCFNFTDLEICKFCEDSHRTQDLLCVVEEPSDIVRVESSGVYRGKYHVLHGALSPLEGVGPEDLKIQPLFDRISAGISGQGPSIREVILALDPDLEGDTTVLYLTKRLQLLGVKVTRIAQGVPIGSDIDFIDDRTMGRALENRVHLE